MIKPFFSSQEIPSIPLCTSCGLHKHVQNPKMQPFGDFRRGILNVGEAPGETEDQCGRQWQGKIGQALQAAYAKLDIDLFEDCLNINAVNCRPMGPDGNNRAPTGKEIVACRPSVLKLIVEHKPKVVMLLGQAAVESVIGPRWPKDLGKIGRWRGWTIPDREFKTWICPTYHPSYSERGDQEVATVWVQDLHHGLSMMRKPLPAFQDETKQVEIIDEQQIPDMLATLRSPTTFDFETTGLKPQASGHRVVCMSVCDQEDHAYAFMMPVEPKRQRWIRAWLRRDKTKKIAQNMKFEDTWAEVALGCSVDGWVWDTMLATHVLDNRSDITGLKFQTYVQFGVADYASSISKWLQSVDPKNGNSKNRIEELVQQAVGRRQLLIYCGMDSLFTRRLAMKQMKIINQKGD